MFIEVLDYIYVKSYVWKVW